MNLTPALSIALTLAPTLTALSIPIASAEAQYQPCAIGDAQAILEVHPISRKLTRLGPDMPGLVDANARCQYRVFLDGNEVTFCESDVFLGGITYFYDYKDAGISRTEAIAALEGFDDRVFIDGQEQQVLRTAYKNVVLDSVGPTVYQHRAVFLQLPPGDYVSYWENTHPEFGFASATVILHILPLFSCS